MKDQRTEYRALTEGSQVFFRCERAAPQEQRYLEGLADNMSLGGLFVSVRHAPAPGTLLRLHIYGGADPNLADPLCAKGIVRWRRIWGKPRGMGVQFLEFEGLGHRRLESWFAAIAESAAHSLPLPPLPPDPEADTAEVGEVGEVGEIAAPLRRRAARF